MYRHAHSWLDGPSEPGPTLEDCQELTDKHLRSGRHLELEEVAAAKLAVEAIEKGKRRDVFWAGGLGGYASLNPHDKASLPLRVFHQLDTELFRGVLRGQVCLASASISSAVHGATRRAGHPYGRVTILLNPEVVLIERPEVILATLIHHMAHAYFLVCCGYGGVENQHDLRHGLPISTLLWTIKACFLRNHRSFPNLFRCTDNLSHHPAASSFGQYGMEGQSYCSWHCVDFKDFQDCHNYLHYTLRTLKLDKKKDDEEGSFEVEQHYPRSQYLHLFQRGASILDPISRSHYRSCNPSCRFIELHYQGKAIPLDLAHLRHYPGFEAHIHENQMSPVKVPKDVSGKTFRALFNFAIQGDYEPVWRSESFTFKGPPRIDTGSGNVPETGPFAPPEDLRVYAVAQKIGFTELRQLALRRLYSQTLLKGDAMDFIEEVYTGKEPGKDKPVACGKGWKPDKDLRDFMVAFLTADHPDRLRVEVEVDDYGRTTPVGRARLEGWRTTRQTNLGLLQGLKWRERLNQLRSAGGAFLEDLDKVEGNLRRGIRVEPPAFARTEYLSWHGPMLLDREPRPLGLGYGYATTNARMDHATPRGEGAQFERWTADGRREWGGREFMSNGVVPRLGYYDPDELTDAFWRLPLN
jgi:hypothetical protein